MERARKVFPGRVVTWMWVTGSRGRACREVSFCVAFSRIARAAGAQGLFGRALARDIVRLSAGPGLVGYT